MSFSSRELGVARVSVLVVTLAAGALGGVAWWLTGDAPLGFAKTNAPAVKVGFVIPEPPKLADEPVKTAAPKNREVEKLKKGEIVQFRDPAGNVRLRKTEPVMGQTGTGLPLQFVLEGVVSQVPFGKMKEGSKEKMGKKKTTRDPSAVYQNGKFTVKPGSQNGEGAKPAGGK